MKPLIIFYYPCTESKNLRTGTVKQVPYSVISLSTVLKKKGYDSIIIDSRFEEDYESKIEFLKDRIVMVGISAMTGYQIVDGLKFSIFIRNIAPQARIVWGGWHPSLLPEQTISNEFIDTVVVGHGEPVITDIVDACLGIRELKEIPNLYYKENSEIIKTETIDLFSMESVPQPDMDLLNIENYIYSSYLGKRTIAYYTSQGCPYRCGFCCDKTVYKQKWQCRSADEVFSFIKLLKDKYLIDSIVFIDTNFFINRKRVEKIVIAMKACEINLKWEASVRSNQIVGYSDNFLQLLYESGCRKLCIGAESGSDEVLQFIQKDTSVEQTHQASEKLYNSGIIGEFYIIAGFPNAPKDDLKASLKMIKEIKERYRDHQFTPFLYTPYPGTPLYQISIEKGFKPPLILEEWGHFSMLNVNTPWIDEKYKDKYNSFVKFYYPLAYPSKNLKALLKDNKLKLLIKLLVSIAKFRLKKEFYAFRVDWRVAWWIDSYQKKLQKSWIPSIR